jgi:uncharacterized protein
MTEPMTLTRDTCWRLLAGTVTGRVGFDLGRGPRIHPVNHSVDGQTIILRTADGSELAMFSDLFQKGALVAFEVDLIDQQHHAGWSVLVNGRLSQVDDAEVHRLARGVAPRPWADGRRDRLLRITPVAITGRRLGDGASRPTSAL